MIKTETVDWMLFSFPEFVSRAQTTHSESRGLQEVLPRTNKPSSPVEQIIMSRDIMQSVVDQMCQAYETLDDYQRAIVHTKYGWLPEERGLKIMHPQKTKETMKIVNDRFGFGDAKFYVELKFVRDTYARYISALGQSIVHQMSGIMPRPKKSRRLDDEQFAVLKKALGVSEAHECNIPNTS